MKRLCSILFLILATGAATIADGNPTHCDVCDGRLREKYWTYEGQACCSQFCVDRLRPYCSSCEEMIEGRYIESEGKKYCSEKCFERTLPKCEVCRAPIHSGFSITRHNYCEKCIETQPNCFSCGLPAAYPTRLPDGREICNRCKRWAVKTPTAAKQHYDRALEQLQAWTKLEIESVPDLRLVSRERMQGLSKDLRKTDSPIPIRGLYSRQVFLRKRGFFGVWKESPEDAKETIYIIDHLHDDVFRVAVMHELMHDLIHEHFPRLEDAPLWVHEGICQQAAAEYCRRRNHVDILQGIETCTDPDYGGGYRYFNKQAGFGGWSALRKWMESVDVDSLPESAPE